MPFHVAVPAGQAQPWANNPQFGNSAMAMTSSIPIAQNSAMAMTSSIPIAQSFIR